MPLKMHECLKSGSQDELSNLINQQEDARGEWENLLPKTEKSSISERRVGSNREDSIWKQDEAMDFALMREEE
ncbi:hypothetical protein TNCV_3760631 [Trichonephila clavipes]|nr:hypothetical protein TNCV_3760631 [Trichonephila clavipes]